MRRAGSRMSATSQDEDERPSTLLFTLETLEDCDMVR